MFIEAARINIRLRATPGLARGPMVMLTYVRWH